jgi:hypothetical protein
VRPFSLDHGAFDNHMVNLLVIVSSLSFVFKVGTRAFSDGVDCAVGGEVNALLRRLTNLE